MPQHQGAGTTVGLPARAKLFHLFAGWPFLKIFQPLHAFLQSQVGGRSLEPQEGDSADAVLSRAEAALREGDLAATVAELSGLPEEALEMMADWTASAQTRIAALEAMDAFAAALDAAN